jgi:predicted dehydrogenase
MGRRHARVFSGLPARFRVVGAFDVAPNSEISAPSTASRLESEAEAIAKSELLVIATPTETHLGCAVRALSAGRHVLVEKPLCGRASEAMFLADLASRGPGRLFVGHSERFNPVVRALYRLLRDDPAVAIDLRRVGPSRPSEVGALLNMGVHDFDLAAYLAGCEISLHSAVARCAPGAKVEDLAHVLFTTAAGAAGHLYVDRTQVVRSRTVTWTTARWTYEGDLLGHRLWRTPRPSGERSEVPLPAEEPLVAQALALADALDGRPSRELATARDGARAVELAERAAVPWGALGQAERAEISDEAEMESHKARRPRRPTSG